MKKILFVCDSLGYGGVEKSLVDLIKYIKSTENIRIDLFLFQNEGVYIDVVKKNVDNIYTFDKKTQEYMKPYKQVILNMVRNFRIIELIKYLCFIVACMLDVKYQKYSIGNKMRFKLIDKSNISLEEYDISVAYSGRHLLYFNNKVKSKTKYTYIHGDVSKLNFTLKELENEYENNDKIICVSFKAKESFLIQLPKLKDKCEVIYNLIDFENIDKHKNEKVEELKADNINLVSVGRLSKEKNYFYLIKTIKNLDSIYKKNLKLYIIGDGPERKKLQRYIEKNDLSENVNLLGYKKNPYKYINRAQFYIQPSVSEGFCLTVYEAFYLKKVILTNNFADVSMLIDNKKDGFVVNNDEEFVSTLKFLIENIDNIGNYEKRIVSISNNSSYKKIKEIY